MPQIGAGKSPFGEANKPTGATQTPDFTSEAKVLPRGNESKFNTPLYANAVGAGQKFANHTQHGSPTVANLPQMTKEELAEMRKNVPKKEDSIAIGDVAVVVNSCRVVVKGQVHILNAGDTYSDPGAIYLFSRQGISIRKATEQERCAHFGVPYNPPEEVKEVKSENKK